METIKLPVYKPDDSLLIELEVLLDDGMLALLSDKKWHLRYRHNSWAVETKHLKKQMFLHRLLWEKVNGPIPKGLVIDHINHNPLDNRFCNLRLATPAQNSRNSRPTRHKNGTKFKGVIKVNNRFRAMINLKGIRTHIGYYATEIEAAKAYNKKAKLHYKKFAYLNKFE